MIARRTVLLGLAIGLMVLSGWGQATPLTTSVSPGKGLGPQASSSSNATTNLSAALGRTVLLASIAAGAVVTLAWCRVAVSWFSNDPSRKVMAKDRARDAALGTFILLAATTGLLWALSTWVLTGV